MVLERIETVASNFSSIFDISLVRKIADGGMGSLYEAELHGPRGFKKTIALKTILETYSNDEQFVELFTGEAKLVADLVHQNICQVYQLGRVGERYFIAMEYIRGVNLRQFMDRHRRKRVDLPPELGTFIISRVCRGLEYAHGKRDRSGMRLGVVHRDVSPGNIMVSTEGEVKLTDFGVAKARNRMLNLAEGQVRVGKLGYMSPEQARFEPTDARADLFSLGAVMFEILTGQTLFGGRTSQMMLRNVLEQPVPSPREINPAIPEGTERVLLKALERDPDRRYQSAGEMGYDLEYQIYHQGYGPTIVTLEKHMRGLFPKLFLPEDAGRWDEDKSDPEALTIHETKPGRGDPTGPTVMEKKTRR
jgi:serine/threonine protein kinase